MRSLILGLSLLCLAPHLLAQTLRSRINDLFTFGDCGEPLCLDLDNEHGSHFIPAVTASNQTVIGFLSEAIGKSTASVPIGATSSGATFAIVGGLPVRTSTSAGPIFGERSQTLGRGRVFLGANVTGVAFTTLSGAPTSNVLINFVHENVGDPAFGDPEFENDIMQLRLRLDVRLTVASLVATWGVLDFIDVGLALPFVRTSIRGASEAQFLPFGNNTVHNFGGDPADPLLRAATESSGSATGLGDVVARVKVNLGQSRKLGAAVMTDLRLPTGNEEEFLGTGAASARVLGVAAAQFGDFAPHLNVGYLARTGELQNDAALITIGFDNLMTDWATLAFDLVSEWQVGASKLLLPEDVRFELPFVRQAPSINIPNKRENLLNASAGVKFTVREGTVLVLNGIAPLRKVGLQPDFVWTVGVEGAF